MASNISVKDSSGSTITMKTTETAGVHTAHVNVDALIPGTGATNLGKAIDSVAGSTDTGVAALAKRRDTPATITPADGDWTALNVDSKGRLQIAPEVNPTPTTSGGCDSSSTISAGTSADEVVVKASAGQVYGIRISNINASPRYVKFYNAASAPTPGAGTPVRRVMVPGNQRVDLVFPVGISFSTGIAFAMVTGAADSASTRVAATEVIVEVDYK
ncbi:MAG: hypothetical protein E6Q97_11615 [Desulfurellales bacterium]|nr:MAG: hypothetical protein E6Q97_11615 [Desulfurellales bacterium]